MNHTLLPTVDRFNKLKIIIMMEYRMPKGNGWVIPYFGYLVHVMHTVSVFVISIVQNR